VRFSRDALRALLRQLRDRFELVLVDAPCWASQPELIALGSTCDAVYLVLEAAQEGKPEISRLIEMIARHGCQLRGCLLTQR
jgi:Mrp family chromosome partitioning ATPase